MLIVLLQTSLCSDTYYAVYRAHTLMRRRRCLGPGPPSGTEYSCYWTTSGGSQRNCYSHTDKKKTEIQTNNILDF